MLNFVVYITQDKQVLNIQLPNFVVNYYIHKCKLLKLLIIVFKTEKVLKESIQGKSV